MLGNNHRLDSAGRLLGKYKDNETLRACWAAALMAGVPSEDCRPEGATDPRIRVPDDSIWSEIVLRAFEAACDKPNSNDPFPRVGFKPDLRGIAYNLDLAAKLLVEAYHVEEITTALIPLGFLHFRAELAWYRSEPGKNPLKAIYTEFSSGASRYEYLAPLWVAWVPRPEEPKPYDPDDWSN